MEYDKMLDKLYNEVKPLEASSERFEIPKVKGHIEGYKTIIANFGQILSVLRRNPEHMTKFLFKELATPGTIDGDRLILNRKLGSKLINEKIEAYANEFVICKECKKPDTELIREDRISSIQCLACGAKHPVRSKI
ncbi:MAG: translation initiation factor IF-2 subunit beta [Nanoarchaeota archaeon]|nr:translation initiation factor IF-2 subunit beta [Nanoarchaeota archaeon]